MNMTSTATFDKQAPLLIRNLENCLRSGYSVLQCFEIVAQDMSEPIKSDARWLVDEVNAGKAFPDVLDNWLTRTPSHDLDLIIATMRVQLEVGGNLADKLNLLGQIFAKRKYSAGS